MIRSFALLCSFAVLALAPLVPGQNQVSDEDHEIYRRSLLDLGYFEPGLPVLITNETEPFSFSGGCAYSLGYFWSESRTSKEDPSFRDSFTKIPESGVKILPGLGDEFEYRLLDLSELEGLEVRGGWEAFHQKYPLISGIASFSGVAYNTQRDKALLYVLFKKDRYWIDALYLIYSREPGGWELIESVKVFHLRADILPGKSGTKTYSQKVDK